MAKRSIVPFGPQHPVLPEPVHLDLVLEDETVVGAVPSIGYVHRGLESLVKKRDFKQYVYIAERICGICSCGHGLGYCMAVENVMGIEVPDRARYLRVIWVEMSRIHSHLLWLGLLADALGFESLFMESWRIREKILDMFDETTGGRIIHSVNKVGGVPERYGQQYVKTSAGDHQRYREGDEAPRRHLPAGLHGAEPSERDGDSEKRRRHLAGSGGTDAPGQRCGI